MFYESELVYLLVHVSFSGKKKVFFYTWSIGGKVSLRGFLFCVFFFARTRNFSFVRYYYTLLLIPFYFFLKIYLATCTPGFITCSRVGIRRSLSSREVSITGVLFGPLGGCSAGMGVGGIEVAFASRFFFFRDL